MTEGESLSENTSKDSEVHVLDLNAEIEKEETNVVETKTVSTFKVINPQIGIDPLKKINSSSKTTKATTVDVDASGPSVTPDLEVESLEDVELAVGKYLSKSNSVEKWGSSWRT